MSCSSRRRLALCGCAIGLACGVLLLLSAGPESRAQVGATGTPTGSPTSAPSRPTVPETPGPTRPTPEETVPPTETPTITATPTVTATPTPRPVHLPMLYRQLRSIRNGGFETGALLPYWRSEGVLNKGISTTYPRSGRYAGRLGDPTYNSQGGCPTGSAAIYQLVDVPAQGRMTLRLWYRMFSYDTVDFDYFAVEIAPWPQGACEVRWRDGCTNWTGNLWDSGWREAAITLHDHRGSTVIVKLANHMTNSDGWYNTWTYVDDVTLQYQP